MTGPLIVSRETQDKLNTYVDLLKKWTPKINLVSKSTLEDVWQRHIVDSAQIFDLAPDSGHWVDLGSGGGLPGIVVAILSGGAGGAHQFTLVESDQRKSVFLRTAINDLDLKARVLSHRIEEIPGQNADVLSARALSDLGTLLGYAQLHLKPSGVALFHKGKSWETEDQSARKFWSYHCQPTKSVTDAAAAVLKIQEISRV